MGLSGGGCAVTNYMVPNVNRSGLGCAAAESTEVDHPACHCPRECMEIRVVSNVAVADDLARITHRGGKGTAPAAESAEVNQPARLCPREGVIYSPNITPAHHLASAIDCSGDAVLAAVEDAEVGRREFRRWY